MKSESSPRVICDMTISLDGYISGPGHVDAGFMKIMDWAHEAFAFRQRYGIEGGEKNLDSDIIDEVLGGSAGAFMMGRTMFDQGVESWGDEPPFAAPVFVLTHRPREPLERKNGTTYHFVEGGVRQVAAAARKAAGDKPVRVSGGGDFFRQVLDADLLDALQVHIAPVLLGEGMPLFTGTQRRMAQMKLTNVRHSERAVHLAYDFSR